MQQVRCGLCGRGFLGDLTANPTCPSCGHAGAIAAAETGVPSAAAVPADVSIVRHFDPATMGQPAPAPVSQPEPAPSEPAPMEVTPLAPVTPRADESPTLPSQPYPAYQAPPTPSFAAQPDSGMTQAETPPVAPAWQPAPPAAAQPAMTPPAPLAQPPQPSPAPPAYTPAVAPIMPAGYAPYQAPPTQPPAQPPYPYAPVQAPGAPYGYPAQPVQPQPPAGYPPIAPTLPYGYPPQGMQAPPNMPLAPGEQPTYGSPYGAPGGFQPPYPGMMVPPQPPEKRRNNTLIAIIAGIVLLAIVLGVIGALALKGSPHANATPTATTQPTATATTSITVPTGFTAYTDANKLFSIGYPSDWSNTDTSGNGVSGVLFNNPDRSDIYEVAQLPASGISTSQISTVLGEFFTGFASSLPSGSGTVANQTAPQDVTIAGDTWTQEAADIKYTDTSGASATAHAEVAAVSHNGHVFFIADATPDATQFATEDALYFTPMTDTFTFLG